MIAIIDYGMGNLRSVEKAFESLGASCAILSSPVSLPERAGVVLPGVGAFGAAMRNLESGGWVDWIRETVAAGTPFLGICLGHQLLFSESEEGGIFSGLGLFPGRVVMLPSSVRIPHMGWNRLHLIGTTPLFTGIPEGSFVYFVHSYYVEPEDPAVVAATASYGVEFAASVGRKNVFGVQFHPEKSQAVGLRILKNFLDVVNGKA